MVNKLLSVVLAVSIGIAPSISGEPLPTKEWYIQQALEESEVQKPRFLVGSFVTKEDVESKAQRPRFLIGSFVTKEDDESKEKKSITLVGSMVTIKAEEPVIIDEHVVPEAPVVPEEPAVPVESAVPVEPTLIRTADVTTTVVMENQESEGVVLNECGASDKFMSVVNSNLNKIPEFMRSALDSSGWQYKVVSTDNLREISEIQTSILGFTDQNAKIIYVTDREKADKTIIHECFHGLDKHFNWISKTAEFIDIYESEVDNFCKLHNTHANNTNIVIEYFAEAGMVYVLNPTGLYDNCPKTYEYIDSWATGKVFSQ